MLAGRRGQRPIIYEINVCITQPDNRERCESHNPYDIQSPITYTLIRRWGIHVIGAGQRPISIHPGPDKSSIPAWEAGSSAGRDSSQNIIISLRGWSVWSWSSRQLYLGTRRVWKEIIICLGAVGVPSRPIQTVRQLSGG